METECGHHQQQEYYRGCVCGLHIHLKQVYCPEFVTKHGRTTANIELDMYKPSPGTCPSHRTSLYRCNVPALLRYCGVMLHHNLR